MSGAEAWAWWLSIQPFSWHQVTQRTQVSCRLSDSVFTCLTVWEIVQIHTGKCIHECLLYRWAVRSRSRTSGTLWWGQKRNNPPAVDQTNGSQWASEGSTWECETRTFLSAYLNYWLVSYWPVSTVSWCLFSVFRGTRRPVWRKSSTVLLHSSQSVFFNNSILTTNIPP